jgi:hypothetical protein
LQSDIVVFISTCDVLAAEQQVTTDDRDHRLERLKTYVKAYLSVLSGSKFDNMRTTMRGDGPLWALLEFGCSIGVGASVAEEQ